MRGHHHRRLKWALGFAASMVLWLGGTATLPQPIVGEHEGEAMAVIGMPLTPMSYAGVARRTVRRSYYYGGYYGRPGYYGYW